MTANTVEGFFGVFKRGMNGAYQHCGERHFERHLDEFTFRCNNRSNLGVEDAERAVLAIKGAEGKRLTYRWLDLPGQTPPTCAIFLVVAGTREGLLVLPLRAGGVLRARRKTASQIADVSSGEERRLPSGFFMRARPG